jgi:annexin A7/11
MKGFGTDEKALIRHLATKDPLQVNVIRQAYKARFSRDLLNDVKGETSGWFEEGLCAIIRGPLLQDVVCLHGAMDGPGTKEKVLNDILLGRSNADLNAIKELYRKTYHQSLESAVKADLSMKTERHFLMVLAANRAEESAPVIPQQVDQDVMEIYKATEGKVGTDELLVCSILSERSNAQISAIAYTYKKKFTKDLDHVIKKVCPHSLSCLYIHTIKPWLYRSFQGIWNTLSYTSYARESTKLCVMRSSSKMRWRALARRIICWLIGWCEFTGIATIWSRSRAPTSTTSIEVLHQEFVERRVAIMRS